MSNCPSLATPPSCTIIGRRVGRPKGFRRDDVIERALVLFREQGYAGTSIQDLVKATGSNRYSLYEEFSDKRGLFIAALTRFQSQKLAEATELLSEPGPKIPLLRRYFESLRERSRKCGPVNCLVTISAVNLASGDEEIAACVLQHFAALVQVFERVVVEAKATGEITSPLPPKSLARALINAARGMRIIAQFEGLDETVIDIAETTLALLEPKELMEGGS